MEAKQKKKKIWPIVAVLFIGIAVLPPLFKKQPETKNDSQLKEEIRNTQAAQTPEEQIKTLVKANLDGENNMGFPYEDKIEVAQTSNGKYVLDIKFNADDNLSKDLIKTGVQMKIAEILTLLFTKRNDIKSVTISALFPLQDKYGNSFRGDIYVAKLEVEEAKQVSWGLDPSYLALTVLPRVYKVSYPYRIF